MRIIEIKYEHKVPRAKFESEMIGLTASVEGDEPQGVLDYLKLFVKKNLTPKEEEVVTESVVEQTPIEELAKEANKESSKEVVEDKEVKEEETKTKEDKADKKTAKKTTKKTTTKKTTTKKSTDIIYNREEESHKKEFGYYLQENHPGWNEDPEIAKKAADLSKSMDGVTPIYKKDGELTDEFKATVREGMA